MNFIIIVSDTFRKDHLGCYGNRWIHTPNIDKLASESVVFDRAYTGSFPTVPNRRDVLTGRYTFTSYDWSPLTREEIVLPRVLGEAGYTSCMVVDTPHLIIDQMGYDRGFSAWKWIRGQEGDRYKTDPAEVKLPCSPDKLRSARTVTQYLKNVSDRRSEEDYFAPMTMTSAMDWLDRNHTRDKFLLYADTFDPHEPWDPPKHYVDLYNPGYKGEEVTYPIYGPCGFMTDPELEHIRALYAAEATMVDTWVGKLLRKTEDLGLLDDTTVIFTTDHGFYFGEHGLVGKFGPIYREMNHIPLMMRIPGIKSGTRRWQMVQPCDLMPTILDLAEVKHPDTIQGKSLVPILNGDLKPVRDIVVTSWGIIHPPVSDKPITLDPGNWSEFARKLRPSTIASDEWTLIAGAGDFQPELYHNANDPGQVHNVFEDNKQVAKDLNARYIALLESLGTKEEYIAPRRKLACL